jgi:hypothetical protein
MATLTREAPDATARRPTQSRTERLRAKTQPVTSDGEYRIGDRLRSRVNPEIEWTVGGMVDGGLTILSPSGQAHDVNLSIIRARFENLRLDADTAVAPVWASEAEIAEFDDTAAGQALRDAEYVQSQADPAPSDELDRSDEPHKQRPRVTSISCGVTRNISLNYNSTEYHAGCTVEIADGQDIAQVAATTYDSLREIIRHEFSKKNGNGKGN